MQSLMEQVQEMRDYYRSYGNSDVWSICYPGCLEHVDDLVDVFSGYRREDAFAAAFCINSWFQNRSVQACALSLNAALLSISAFGKQQISTYDQFLELFESIQALCPVSPMEDEVVPVMGHVKLEFGTSWYPVMLGCGLTREYPRLCFAETISDASGKRNSYEVLLRYVANMCEVLDKGGGNPGEAVNITLACPSNTHWNNVKSWFDACKWNDLPKDIVDVLSCDVLPVELRHFIRFTGTILPLFNPSLLHDFLKICSNKLSTDVLVSLTDRKLATEAGLIYPIDEHKKAGCINFAHFCIDGNIRGGCPCTFLLYDNSGTLTVFYNDYYDDTGLLAVKDALKNPNSVIEIIEGIPSKNNRRKALRLDATAIKQVLLVAYLEDVIPPLVSIPLTTENNADVTCGALDIMSILHMSSSVREINDFICLVANGKYEFQQVPSGLSAHFVLWKDNNHAIFTGVEFGGDGITVISDFNETDRWYCRFFENSACNYPFVAGNHHFNTPFAYQFEESSLGFTSIRGKSDGEWFGRVRRLDGIPYRYVHLHVLDDTNGLVNDEILDGEEELFEICSDAIMRCINDLNAYFYSLADSLGGLFSICYVPEFMIPSLRLRAIDKELGLYGALNATEPFAVCYAIEKHMFIPKLMDTCCRDIECRLVIGIVRQYVDVSPTIVKKLTDKINKLSKQFKTVDIVGIKLPYRWRVPLPFVTETDDSKAHAIRTVASAALSAGISPGRYMGKEANKILRSFQGTLTNEIEVLLSGFERNELLASLYEIYAQAEHSFYVNTMQYGAFTKLSKDHAQSINKATIDAREESRHRLRTLRFCIETLLCLAPTGTETADKDELEYIVSLGSQLLSLCDEADILLFEPKGFGIEVDHDYIVSALEEGKDLADTQSLRMRLLEDVGHIGGSDIDDRTYVKKAKDAFRRDTAIGFECFIQVLDILALGMEEKTQISSVAPNVLVMPRNRIIELVTKSIDSFHSANEVSICIDFLTIDPSRLCSIGDKRLDYLPFGRIKDRPNRFELKPVIRVKDGLMFSPVSAGVLRERWMRGISDRFLPVKETFNNLYGIISQWKKHYEKALEKDAQTVFLNSGFRRDLVHRGIELRKRGNHPQNLGDYDVLAYDERNETIWAIECKEFEKIESAYDFMQLQDRWFSTKGLLSKFERRVSYLKDNTISVAKDLSFHHDGELTVKAYLVSNKLFQNLMGESSFEVITLSELKELLAAYTLESRGTDAISLGSG